MDTLVREVLKAGNAVAAKKRLEFLGYDHIALALVLQSRAVHELLKALGIKRKALLASLSALLDEGPEGVVVMGRLPLTKSASLLVAEASQLAESFSHAEPTTLHLFLALFDPKFENIPVHTELVNVLGERLEEIRARVSQDPSEKLQAALEAKDVKEDSKLFQLAVFALAKEQHFRAEDYAAFVKAIAEPGNPHRDELWELMERFRLSIDLV